MAKGNNHPYIPSPGLLVQTFSQLRKMFPAKVDAETLRRLSLAPKNESVVISTLKFLGFIDDDGNKTSEAAVFLKHDDTEFANALEKVVKEKYAELFAQSGDQAWELDRDSLIGFFRVNDETSALTAKRQAITFETLSALCGHGETPSPRTTRKDTSKATQTTPKSKEKKTSQTPIPTSTSRSSSVSSFGISSSNDIGLTVRIEINLPAQGDQETYDRIFQSIRKNLLNG
jgi:hypothetical protein